MKLVSVTFRCFGPFEEQLLDLSSSGGLHVIFGPNEAGKSSALRGLHALLFGFPTQSSDDFRFRYSEFRILARLQNAACKTLDCVRRKGKKATLLAADEKSEVAESIWAEFLGGLQQTQFNQLFGLDSQLLVDGGQQIADGQGDLGEALFAAGAGLAGLRALAKSLEDRQFALYRFRGQTQLINKTLSSYESHIEEVRKQMLPPETYAAAAQASLDAHQKAKSLRDERTKVRSQLGLLQRYQAALPTIELLQRARKRLAFVANAPLLAEGFDVKLCTAREKREIARNKLEDLTTRQRDLEGQILNDEPPALVLAEETEVDELKKLIGADVKQQSEAIKADTRRSELQSKARDIYRELTGSTTWEQMPSLKPRLDHQQRITELANEHAAVLEDVTKCETAVQLAKESLSVARGKLANLPSTNDPTVSLATIESIASHGPIEQHAQALNSEVAEEEVCLANEFARFHPTVRIAWREVISVPVLSPEAISQFQERFDRAYQAIAKADDEYEQIEREIRVVREQLVDTAGAEPVPTVNDLSESRGARDAGLHLIRRRLSDEADSAVEQGFISLHAPGRPLIDATEVTVRQCDALADRLRHEADRVANWQTLQHKLELLQTQLEEAVEDRAAAEAILSEIKHEWELAWQPSGIVPDSPVVMQAWLVRWQRFSEKVAFWNNSKLKCQKDEHRIAVLKAELAATCAIVQQTKTLAEGLHLARQASNEARKNIIATEKLNDEALRLEAGVATAESELVRANNRQVNWMKQWSDAITILGLGESSVSVSTVQDYLRRIGEMQQYLTDMRIKAARVKEISDEQAMLIERVSALRQRLCSGARATTKENLDADFRDVSSSLEVARTQRTQHQELAKQLNKVKAEIVTTSDALRDVDAALAAMVAQANVASVDELELAVQRANERILAAKQMQDQENALAQNSRDQPIDVFLTAALDHGDRLDQEIEILNHRAQELDPEIAAAEGESLTCEQVINTYRQASDTAAESKQQAELSVGRLEDYVIEYASLCLARVALDRAKERYRAKHQGSMLSRAGAFFRLLTDQAFEGLDIDNEEGRDVLRAVRASGHPCPRVPVSGLSDGTRDQLFLSLRLAGIEQHLVDREPVPVIVDDVLVNFDDARTSATLKCLVELAKKTQVLLFTHHRHVVDLAVAVDSATVVHELCGPSHV